MSFNKNKIKIISENIFTKTNLNFGKIINLNYKNNLKSKKIINHPYLNLEIKNFKDNKKTININIILTTSYDNKKCISLNSKMYNPNIQKISKTIFISDKKLFIKYDKIKINDFFSEKSEKELKNELCEILFLNTEKLTFTNLDISIEEFYLSNDELELILKNYIDI